MDKTNIALVDDHTLFRSGIANLLKEFDDIEIVFEAANGKELQKLLNTATNVQVILMDINMPVMDGYACTAWVKQTFPKVNVLALSMFDDEAAIIKMLRSGAGGYVLKESKPSELHRAIIEIQQRGFYVNDIVTGNMIRSLQRDNISGGNNNTPHLTPKENEFLQLCASEFTYKEIAEEMGIATRTVDNYRESLFDKLKVKSRIGIVLYGLRNGLIKL